MSKTEFGEGIMYTATKYIYWFLLGNFYFWILNIPFIFMWLSFSINPCPEYALLVLLSSIPIGPALATLLSCMGKLVREKDINLTKEFFKGYKNNFSEAVFYWVLELVALVIIYFDIIYFKTKFSSNIVVLLFLVIGLFIIGLGFMIFPIITRFRLRVKDVFKISLKYFLKKIHLTISNIAIIIALFMISTKVHIIFLFLVSVGCYSVMYFNKGILEEIEENLKVT